MMINYTVVKKEEMFYGGHTAVFCGLFGNVFQKIPLLDKHY